MNIMSVKAFWRGVVTLLKKKHVQATQHAQPFKNKSNQIQYGVPFEIMAMEILKGLNDGLENIRSLGSLLSVLIKIAVFNVLLALQCPKRLGLAFLWNINSIRITHLSYEILCHWITTARKMFFSKYILSPGFNLRICYFWY